MCAILQRHNATQCDRAISSASRKPQLAGMHSHSKQPNSFFQTLQPAVLLQIGGTQEICKRPWPEAVSLLTLQPVIDHKNPRVCCQHLCWLLQQGLTQLTSCLQRRLTFDQLPALTIVSSTDSHSLGSFSQERATSLPGGPPLTAPGTKRPAPRPQSRHSSASTLSYHQ